MGTDSFAAMTSMVPSIKNAPASMLVISDSWPGQSTKLTALSNFVSLPQTGHLELVQNPAGAGVWGHL